MHLGRLNAPPLAENNGIVQTPYVQIIISELHKNFFKYTRIFFLSFLMLKEEKYRKKIEQQQQPTLAYLRLVNNKISNTRTFF
jgi:hypothetical protein